MGASKEVLATTLRVSVGSRFSPDVQGQRLNQARMPYDLHFSCAHTSPRRHGLRRRLYRGRGWARRSRGRMTLRIHLCEHPSIERRSRLAVLRAVVVGAFQDDGKLVASHSVYGAVERPFSRGPRGSGWHMGGVPLCVAVKMRLGRRQARQTTIEVCDNP